MALYPLRIDMNQDKDDLTEIINDSLQSLEGHIDKLDQIPIDETYKSDIKGTLVDVKSSLEAARPILEHLEKVQDLVIHPVRDRIDKAFSASNKWGMLGIQLSVISISLTIIFSLGDKGIVNLPFLYKENELIEKVASQQECKKPELFKVLKSFYSKNKSVFVSGKCLSNSTFKLSGFDLITEVHSDGLIEIKSFPYVYNSPAILEATNLKEVVSENGREFAEHYPVDENKYRVRYASRSDSFDINDFRSSLKLNLPSLHLDKVWETKEAFAIGDEPEYFNNKYELDDIAKTIEFKVDKVPKDSKKAYILIEAAGIGPGTSEFITSTQVEINGNEYDLINANPYLSDVFSQKRVARIAIPIGLEVIKHGTNVIRVQSGRYKGKDKKIGQDNLIVYSLGIYIAEVQQKNAKDSQARL